MTRSTKDAALKRSGDKRRIDREAKAILLTLGPSLQERGVPRSGYIVVDVDSGEFVTGRSAAEAVGRFKVMHPRSRGWLQRPEQS
jgi:hypothetical protein